MKKILDDADGLNTATFHFTLWSISRFRHMPLATGYTYEAPPPREYCSGRRVDALQHTYDGKKWVYDETLMHCHTALASTLTKLARISSLYSRRSITNYRHHFTMAMSWLILLRSPSLPPRSMLLPCHVIPQQHDTIPLSSMADAYYLIALH